MGQRKVVAGSLEGLLTTGIQRSSEAKNGGIVTGAGMVFGPREKKQVVKGRKSSFYPRPYSIDSKYFLEILRLVKGILKTAGEYLQRKKES